MRNISILITTILLFTFTGCGEQEKIFVKSKCPYVKPITVELRKNKDGTLNKFYTDRAYKALGYYGPETRRVYTLLHPDNKED